MLRRVALVRTDVSEENSATIRVMEMLGSFEIPVLTRATLRNIPEDGVFLQSLSIWKIFRYPPNGFKLSADKIRIKQNMFPCKW
jgi:hypothetical protein